METWQKRIPFYGTSPIDYSPINDYFLLELKKVGVRFKKNKIKFYKETLKITLVILYRPKSKLLVLRQ